MSSETDPLRDLFHEEGRRLTPQRRLVLQVLQSSDRHLDAEAIHDRVKVHDSDISLATVYRSLHVLRQLGLVEEHSLGEDHRHFEATRSSPHYHFVCSRCGRIAEFDTPLVETAVAEFAEARGVQVTDAHLRLSGYCASCLTHPRNPETHA